ncbi:MAG: redox-regulated molecular chaperone Hsp33, partial [Burkholderiales bacterium PBB4]
EDAIGRNEDYNRIAMLTRTLKREELLELDVDTVLKRLYWEEPVIRYEPLAGDKAPRFSCNCSRERVGRMIVSLGAQEAESILAERETIEVGCEFCGVQYQFDAVDAAQLFTSPESQITSGPATH